MTKDKLKNNVIRTICSLNSDISGKDRQILIELLNSIIDYTNNTELEQKVTQLQQEYDKLVEDINKLKTSNNGIAADINNNVKPKITNLETRVTALENSSQS
jgi:hypothetical protein